MSENIVIRITEKDLVWDLPNEKSVDQHVTPKFLIRRGNSNSPVYVDPYPGYSHSASLTHQELLYVASKFPIQVPMIAYLPVFDSMQRVNGLCINGIATNDRESNWINTSIILYGKRTPIHPALTKYLVAHEYGHAVQCFLEMKEHIIDEPSSDNPFINEYAERRGLPKQQRDTKWHASPQEVFANDFRILICRREIEFWPHIGILRPTLIKGLSDWWYAQLEKCIDVPNKIKIPLDGSHTATLAISQLAEKVGN